MAQVLHPLIMCLILIAMLFFIGLIFTGTALAQENNSTNTSIAERAMSQQDDTLQIHYLGLPYYLITIIAIVLILPLVIDQFYSYKHAKGQKDGGQPTKGTPTPMSGLYRALMTFGVILLIGSITLSLLGMVTSTILRPLPETIDSLSNLARQIDQANIPSNATIQLMEILEENNDASISLNTSLVEIIKTVATVLAGAVTTIIGFYFGNKAATESSKAEPSKTEPTEKEKGKIEVTKDVSSTELTKGIQGPTP